MPNDKIVPMMRPSVGEQLARHIVYSEEVLRRECDNQPLHRQDELRRQWQERALKMCVGALAGADEMIEQLNVLLVEVENTRVKTFFVERGL